MNYVFIRVRLWHRRSERCNLAASGTSNLKATRHLGLPDPLRTVTRYFWFVFGHYDGPTIRKRCVMAYDTIFPSKECSVPFTIKIVPDCILHASANMHHKIYRCFLSHQFSLISRQMNTSER
ncbi:hypothetical protein TNCV_1284751 [Trichonephila clavipes]|uniref:Uncharacterized protein n=1 Tax=Trichonephila clavipes TaxID=2585209 RepID=A0A8X6VQA2_TRICX|nr:hypothetical protein TNCV_1284751 [Trichonephila clavipes]